MSEREVVGWFTMNGNHIPIFKGESQQDAVNRAIADSNEKQKQSDIAKNKQQADKLNGKDEEYRVFPKGYPPDMWLDDPEVSNNTSWIDTYKTEEDRVEVTDALWRYTSRSYKTVNDALYNKPWDKISDETKQEIAMLQDAINRYEVHKGIEVTRQSDFVMLGAEEFDKMTLQQVKDFFSATDGIVQNDAFMSFSFDDTGRAIMGHSGLVTHLRIPPAKGAGMYIAPYSGHPSEREYLLNNNAILKYDVSKFKQTEDGKIHVYADWLGQADKRTIDRR